MVNGAVSRTSLGYVWFLKSNKKMLRKIISFMFGCHEKGQGKKCQGKDEKNIKIFSLEKRWRKFGKSVFFNN